MPFIATSSTVTLIQAARQTPPAADPTTILGAVWIAALVIFVFSVWASGFTAKRINNISGANYSKAFLATFLKGLLSLTGIFVFGLFLQAPTYVAIAIAYSLIPITIYKILFACMWREAMLIWFVALIVETIAATGLVFVGALSLVQLMGGA